MFLSVTDSVLNLFFSVCTHVQRKCSFDCNSIPMTLKELRTGTPRKTSLLQIPLDDYPTPRWGQLQEVNVNTFVLVQGTTEGSGRGTAAAVGVFMLLIVCLLDFHKVHAGK